MIRELGPGKIYYDYGPISMVISAWRNGIPLTQKCKDSTEIALKCLTEISSCLERLKEPWPLCREEKLRGLAKGMWTAAKATGAKDLTPMAAVAGAVSDHVADWLFKEGATKVIVNNGGDVALRLAEDEETCVGIVPFLGAKHYDQTVKIKGTDNMGGIATSGLGGRSFTKGIADSVTVFAERCIIADVFATTLANESFIPSPRVKQMLAKTIDPNTDIPGEMVTVAVEKLEDAEIEQSFKQVRDFVENNSLHNMINAVFVHLQGKRLIIP